MKKATAYDAFKIGYLIFPFFSFLLVLKNYKSPWFKNALWLFIIFYGFSMSFVETIDANSYKLVFENSAAEFSGFNSVLDIFDQSKTGQIDFADPLINYVLSIFTQNYHFLFGVYGLIFGYFYSRNISFILTLINSKNKKFVWGLILFVSCFIGFWNINGFRFWTACHIFLYAIINYIYLRKRFKGILFILLALTFHLSFVIPFILFVIKKYIPKTFRIYTVMIFLLTLYNPLDNLKFVQNTVKEYVQIDQIEDKVDLYTSDETLERSEASSVKTNTFKVVLNFLIVSYILIISWLIIPKMNIITTSELDFYHYGVSLALLGSILNFIPSVGVRFTNVGLFIMLFGSTVMILRYGFLLDKRKLLSKLGFISCAMIFMINIWIFFTFSIQTILGNFVSVLLDSSEILYSVGDLTIDLIK